MLARAGFAILQQSFVEHAPRYVTIRLAPRLASSGSRRMDSLLVAAMHFLERLAGTPFSRFTGHYSTWIAVRTHVRP